MLDELPALIATGYADVPEEDIVRLKWWGLYHDKPKVGTFMLRIKLAAGRLTPAQLQAIGEPLDHHGRGEAELTTRQTIQLHYLRLAELPDVFEQLARRRPDDLGGCGDAVRNVTGCPSPGSRTTSCSTRRRWSRRRTPSSTGNPDYVDLPRKHKISIGACADRCNAPEINCISLVGALHEGERDSACSSAAGSPPCRGSRASSASSSSPTRRSPCCARCSTPGGGPALPRLAREGADEVHGRRLRPRGHARRGRARASATRCPTSRCPPLDGQSPTTSACSRRSRTG